MISLAEKGGVLEDDRLHDEELHRASSHHSQPRSSHSQNTQPPSQPNSHHTQSGPSHAAAPSSRHNHSGTAQVAKTAGGTAAPEDIDVQQFENAAFQQDQVSPDQPSHTSSERALSQYAETASASMSVGDVEQDVSTDLKNDHLISC